MANTAQTTRSREIFDLVETLWAAGQSYSEIAKAIAPLDGSSGEPGVAAGLVHRLKLPRRGRKRLSAEERLRRRRATYRASDARRIPGQRVAPTKLQPPEPEELVIPVGQRRSIFELAEGICRAPIGDPKQDDFFYCGAKAIEGLPYCGYHARMFYQPIMESDKRRWNREMDHLIERSAA